MSPSFLNKCQYSLPNTGDLGLHSFLVFFHCVIYFLSCVLLIKSLASDKLSLAVRDRKILPMAHMSSTEWGSIGDIIVLEPAGVKMSLSVQRLLIVYGEMFMPNSIPLWIHTLSIVLCSHSLGSLSPCLFTSFFLPYNTLRRSHFLRHSHSLLDGALSRQWFPLASPFILLRSRITITTSGGKSGRSNVNSSF